jgi:Arc/MetJ family transcription regulator
VTPSGKVLFPLSDPDPIEVYHWCMARTNIDIDEEAVQKVMDRYQLRTKRDAVNFALRSVAGEPLGLERARGMRGSGWEGDLDDMRGTRSG